MEKIGKKMYKIIILILLILDSQSINSQVEIFEKLSNHILNKWNIGEKVNLDTNQSINGKIHIDTYKISKTLPNTSEIKDLIKKIDGCELDKINKIYNFYLDLYLSEFGNYKYYNLKIARYQSIILEFEKLIFKCSNLDSRFLSDTNFVKFYEGYILTSNCWWNKNLSLEDLNSSIDSIHALLKFNKRFIKLLITQTGFFDIFKEIIRENMEAFNPYLVACLQNNISVVNFNTNYIDLNELPLYLEAEYFEFYKDYTSTEFQFYLAHNLDKTLKRNYSYMWQVIGNTGFASADSLFNAYFLSEVAPQEMDVDFEGYIYSNSGKERASRLIIQELEKSNRADKRLYLFLALTKTKSAKFFLKQKIENANKQKDKIFYQNILDILEKP